MSESLEELKRKQKEAIEKDDIDAIVGLQDQIDRKRLELAYEAGRQGKELPHDVPLEPDEVVVYKRGGKEIGYGRPLSPKNGQTLSVGDLTKKKKGEGGEHEE